MPPWGSKQMLLGTNPFCMAAPAGKHRPIILDMSPAVAARGKIRRAERRGETIPLGYALDAQGRPTSDPKAALAGGVVLPIGEHKGSGIAMFMDIFGGVISGANFGGDVGDQYKAFDRAQDVGHFFLAMKPNIQLETLAGFESAEGLALLHGKWTMTGTGPDGPIRMEGRNTEVVRRQLDGRFPSASPRSLHEPPAFRPCGHDLRCSGWSGRDDLWRLGRGDRGRGALRAGELARLT